MDFIRNLFTLIQRLHEILRDGQKRGDVPGMAMAMFREVRGGDRDADGQGDGPAVYQGKRAHADQATPEAASRATARNKASRNTDLPEPAVYRSPAGADTKPEFEPARAPARNADDPADNLPEPASVAPLQREDYDYKVAAADTSQIPDLPEPARASEPKREPEPAPEPELHDEPAPAVVQEEEREAAVQEPPSPAPAEEPVPATATVQDRPAPAEENKREDGWFDLGDWQGTALKVAGVGAAAAATAAGAMAIKDRFFDDDDGDNDDDRPADDRKPALPLTDEAESTVDDSDGGEWMAAAATAAPLAAAAVPLANDPDERPEERAAPAPSRTPHPVEIIPANPHNPTAQPASQSLANPGIRLYGTMDAAMYAEFTERLSEQAPGGPIVIALTTMEGDPEIARSMADDIRLLRDRARREIIFLGKTAVYGAGVLFMAAFPVSHRFLTRATKLLVTENKRAQPIELAGGSLRSVASQLEHFQREIQREIEQEDEDYRAISDGSNVSIQELREKAPNEWFITASEAKAMGLIAEVV